MAMQGGPNRLGQLSEINVTPLVDVMLVLLVVFMVTTPIIVEEIQQRKVEVDLPTTNAEPVKPSELQTILILDKDYTVALDLGQGATELASCAGKAGVGFDQCLGDLEPKFRNNKPLQDGRRVFLMADRTLAYGFVVDVMARLKRSGITNLGMVTNPQGDGG